MPISEAFVSSMLHEKVARAGRERLGLRAIGGDGGRPLRLVWSVVPFGESYWLTVTLHEEGAGVPIVRNARVVVAAFPESMRRADPDPDPDPDPVVSPIGGKAILAVETEPAGASVVVGGVSVGETPLNRSDLRPGSWGVVLDHPWYETVRLEGQVLENRRVLRIRAPPGSCEWLGDGPAGAAGGGGVGGARGEAPRGSGDPGRSAGGAGGG